MIHVYLKYWAQAYKRSFIRDPILNVSIESVSDMFLHFDKKWLKFIPSGGMSKECQQDIRCVRASRSNDKYNRETVKVGRTEKEKRIYTNL